jgi:hypothetical protein
MTPITSNRDCLFVFTKELYTFLEEQVDRDDLKSSWKDDWINLKNAGFGTKKFSRLQLAKHILGSSTKDKSVTNIITGLRKSFPPIDNHFSFIPTSNDSDLWHMEIKKNEDEKKPDFIDEVITMTDNIKDNEKETNSIMESKSDSLSTIDNIENIQINPTWQTIPITKTSEVPTTIPMKTTSFASKNSFGTLLEHDNDNEDDNDEFLSYSDTTDHEKKLSPLSNKSKVQNPIRAKLTNETMEILKKINNLKNENKILTEHATIDELMIWIDTQVKEVEYKGQVHKHRIKETENNFSQLYKQANTIAGNTTKVCNGMYEKMKKDKLKFATEIDTTKSEAIIEINTTANRRKAETINLIDQINKLSKNLNDQKSLPQEILKQIENATKFLKSEIQQIFDNYEEQSNDMIDEQKASIRKWLENLMGNNSMKAVHNLNEETEKLKASRLLLDTKHKEIDRWFKQKKNDFQQLKQQYQQDNTSVNDQSTVPTPPFQPDTAVKYNKDLYNVYGYIMQNHKYEHGKWYFEIFTMNGTTIHNCCEDDIVKHEDIIPPSATTSKQSPIRTTSNLFCKPTNDNKSSPTRPFMPLAPPDVKQEMINENDHIMHRSSNWHPNGHHTRRLAQNEFQYPLNSLPLSVNQTLLIKHAEKWEFDLTNELELRGFYDSLTNFFRQYNIYLREYNDIEKDEGLELITPMTCKNYKIAKEQMSQAIMTFFQTYGKDIFKNYSAPLDYIAAFKANSNGLGYLKRILKKRHPRLKDIINRKTPSAPSFNHYQNIHIFIQAYIEWLHDEQLRGGREYDNKEQLDYVLTNLDERFAIAIAKIDSKLDQLYADPFDPQPIPKHLRVTNELGMYITDLIPDDKKEDLTNNVAKLFAVQTRSNRKKERVPRDKYNYRQSQRQSSSEEGDTKDINTNDLEWKIIPGAKCPACKKNNHNVYKTGCPALGLFAHCQHFYDTQPKKLIDKVKTAFDKYQRELGKKMMERRNKDRSTLRTVAATYGEEDLGALRDAMFDEYKNDFREEQYNEENPYDDFYFDESLDDIDDDSEEN